MTDKLMFALGLCRKAGKLAVGADATAEAAEKKRAYAILLSSDAAQRTQQAAEEAAAKCGAPLHRVNRTIAEMEKGTGRAFAVAAVTGRDQARLIELTLEQENGGTVCL